MQQVGGNRIPHNVVSPHLCELPTKEAEHGSGEFDCGPKYIEKPATVIKADEDGDAL